MDELPEYFLVYSYDVEDICDNALVVHHLAYRIIKSVCGKYCNCLFCSIRHDNEQEIEENLRVCIQKYCATCGITPGNVRFFLKI